MAACTSGVHTDTTHMHTHKHIKVKLKKTRYVHGNGQNGVDVSNTVDEKSVYLGGRVMVQETMLPPFGSSRKATLLLG